MHVIDVGCWVSVRELLNFSSAHLSDFIDAAILSDSLEVCVNHGVGVSLSALNPETTMEEAGVSKHFPHNRVTPIVGSHLWVYLNAIVVMSGLQNLRDGEHLVHGNAD